MNKLTEDQFKSEALEAKLWELSKAAWECWKESGVAPGDRINHGRLDEYQEAFDVALKKDIHALDGVFVMLGVNSGGEWYNTYPYKGKVVGVVESGYIPQLKLSIVEGDKVWEENAYLYRIWPIQEYVLPSPEERKQQQLDRAVEQIERHRKNYVNVIASEIEERESQMRNFKREIIRNKKLISVGHEQMEIAKKDKAFSKEAFFASLERIKKNKHVTWAALDDKDFYFETDMLYAINKLTGKINKERPLGRFAIQKSRLDRYGSAYNLDYNYEGYDHPFVESNSICFGDDDSHFQFLAQTGKFYLLIDSFINFFSIFPSDSGNPYIGHKEWLENREEQVGSNPYKGSSFLWEYKTEEPKKVVTTEPIKKSVTVRANEMVGIEPMPLGSWGFTAVASHRGQARSVGTLSTSEEIEKEVGF